MSWVTTIWGMLIGGCVALALPHLLVGVWQRRGAHLFFVLTTASVITIAVGELSMLRANSVEQFVGAVRWMQVPVFFLVIALVGFIRLYLGTGRLWLGVSACAMRFVCVIVNFAVEPSLSYQAITGLRQLRLLGENVSAAEGVISPRIHLAEFSSVLLLLFLVDALIGSWKKGTPDNRRRALVMGGSTVFFVILAASMAALTQHRVIEMPYLISFPYAAILLAMAFELGSDLFRAGIVAHKLEVSESSLQESEERFRNMADAAPVLIWMSGPDKLCTFFNKAWLAFTGRTMEQELGNGWTEGVHLDDFEKCSKTYIDAFDARKPFAMQYRLKRHDGEYRWVTDNGVPRYGVHGNFRGYIGACVDITDLLKQEQALHESEERVALAADAAHLGVWEIDTTNKKLWISDKVRELFQFEPETPITYAMFQARIHPEDRALRDQAVKRAIETKGGYEIEYRILLPDGTVRWIGGRARCVSEGDDGLPRLLGVSADVTGRKQAEEKLAQLSQRNKLILDSAGEGILGLDLQGNHTFVNPAAARMLGYEPEELIGRHSHSMWHHTKPDGSPYPIEECNIYAAYRDGTVHRVSSEVFWRKDGSSFPVEYSSMPVFDQGQLVGAVVTFIDISRRKRAEEEAHRQREQINILSRVSLLGEMTASLAHELNQPLSAIVSNANAGMRFIDKGRGDSGTLREILVDVVADGRRAHDIIGNVRKTIKKGGAIREPINLNDAVMKVTRMIQSDAAAHFCEVETSLAENLPAIEGDPTQIQQVLINLVGNAFDAMRNTPVNRRKVEISTGQDGDGIVCVCVRDHGLGIRKDAQERLFEQFFTTKEEGLGMGLAIVRSIIESHGGRIAAENVEGGGARFYFTLPTNKKTRK